MDHINHQVPFSSYEELVDSIKQHFCSNREYIKLDNENRNLSDYEVQYVRIILPCQINKPEHSFKAVLYLQKEGTVEYIDLLCEGNDCQWTENNGSHNKVITSQLNFTKILEGKSRKLYKFFTPQKYNVKALRENYLWFSKKASLNDPFELMGHNLETDFPVLYNNLEKKSYTIADAVINNLATCSFSTSEKNLLMWAYYTDSYRGWCLEFSNENIGIFDKDKLENQLSPLMYLDKYPDINDTFHLDSYFNGDLTFDADVFTYTHTLSSDGNLKLMWNDGIKRLANYLSGFKSNIWSHENEWRATVRTEDSKGCAVYFNRSALKSIIVGFNISKYKLKKLKRIAKYYRIPLYMIETKSIEVFTLSKRLVWSPT